ncbi:MAG: hypothetical protein U5R48_19640 [Gammaproteobacteria bacterium]|nr:hypothetical protein [Gammaproteobacteria bacterium]
MALYERVSTQPAMAANLENLRQDAGEGRPGEVRSVLTPVLSRCSP